MLICDEGLISHWQRETMLHIYISVKSEQSLPNHLSRKGKSTNVSFLKPTRRSRLMCKNILFKQCVCKNGTSFRFLIRSLDQHIISRSLNVLLNTKRSLLNQGEWLFDTSIDSHNEVNVNKDTLNQVDIKSTWLIQRWHVGAITLHAKGTEFGINII